MDDVQQEMRQRRREWRAAVNAGDLDAYADLVTEDLVWLPPAGDAIEGRKGFRDWLEPFFGRYSYEFSVEPARVRAFEGWCAETGTFRSVMTPRSGGEPQVHGGSYTLLWRREDDGVWRIERYVDGLGPAQ